MDDIKEMVSQTLERKKVLSKMRVRLIENVAAATLLINVWL